MALGLEDVRVGVWTSDHAPTGCTVILPPEVALGAVAVRGSSPGTREAVALGPHGKLTVCHAVVLSGGSAYGLATADGVMRELDRQGIGYPVATSRVPIVGAAIVLDQGVSYPDHRPDAEAGRLAVLAASADDPAEGAVGAGRGTTVAKIGGLDHCWRGGQGVAVRSRGDLVVGALVVNNAVGELRDLDGRWIARSRAPEDAERFPWVPIGAPENRGSSVPSPVEPLGGGPTQNTVIGCIVTNARLTKTEAHRVADLGHTGIARVVHPAHTSHDGDALFCLATHRVDATVDQVAELAAAAVAEAALRGPQLALGHTDIPGLADPR